TDHIGPPNSDSEELLVDAISRRDYRRRLYEVVAEFMHDCTSWMMTYGKAIYEIAYLYDKEDKPTAFVLQHILPTSVKTERGKLVQYIPKSVGQKMGITTEIIELITENIVIFELPAYMRDDYLPMMSALYAQGEITS